MNKEMPAMRPMNNNDLEVLALRESGLKFEEIAKRLPNKQTGQLGVSACRARQIYHKALAKKPRYERKKAQEPYVAYVRLICATLLDEEKYFHS